MEDNVQKKSRFNKHRFIENLQIYSLFLPVLILIFIFHYVPMYGVVIAFQDYMPGNPFIGRYAEWVGLANFTRFMRSEFFFRLIRNTLVLSGLNLIFGFTTPIVFALLIDQITALRFKKFIQTASYMPYFISWVIVAGMAISFIDVNGLVTNFLTIFGVAPRNFRVVPTAFPVVYTITMVWKNFGFGSILYIATITSIDPGLYESAKLDGANRWKQVWHITLPGLKHVIIIHLILAIGGILHANTELILLLYTPATYVTADVIGTYMYRVGILGGQFSLTTAAGLFMSGIGFILAFSANRISNKVTGLGFW